MRRDAQGWLHGYIMCDTPEGREAWVARLRKLGYNYFLRYHDLRSRFALSFAYVQPAPDSHLAQRWNPSRGLFKNPGYDLINL